MDPTNSYLGRLLLEEITPVVMVLSTPLAEEACQKNGFNFVQMLHPFCAFNNIDVPVRTANDQPYRLQMFKLRFFYASEICRQDQEVAVKHLREVISNASEKSMSDLQFDPPQLESLLSMSEPEIVPPWFHIFNRDLSRALSFSDHEAFDHPIACLLVVSSEDEQPMNKFVDLFNTNQLPSLLSDSAMDPKILKNYLLLHDRQHGAMEKASGILAEMRSTFGLNDCKLLCINSMKDESMVWNENPWCHYRASTSQEGIACCLNIDDLNEIKDFMQDLSSKKIIPHMEQKIRILNQQVSVTRKGFKNQIKNLWWRKGKEDAPDTPNGPVYTYSSIESQMRVLGDYAFMLRDYELALSNYRLLSTDYKLDKAWKRYAGVQEMMGLSLFMLDQSRKDSEYCMETAFSTYLRTDSSGLKNAVRCGLWWAEMLKARGQHKDAAGVYFRLSSEELSLHAAVMLEQASYCYLFSRPPMIRKFGFHLVLAGNQYYMSDQKKHAIRAYRIALSVYRENVWSYINDHVHFNIGRWYALFEMFDAATKHMLKVIECTHQPPTTQDLILKDFLHIVQNMGRNFEVPKLHLPSINLSSPKVIFEDNRTYASPDAIGVKENTWHSFEENMVPSIATVRSNWLESRKLHSSKKYNGSSASAVGEAIKVFFELKNPLKVTLSVSGLSLVCEHSARPAEDSDSTSINELQNSVVLGWSPSSRDTKEHSSFVLSELDFDMVGGETREVQLHVTPKIEGILKIVGVKWMLSELLVGYHKFDIDKRKKIKKGRETDGSLMNNMTFIVVKGLPKLECSIHHLPRKAYLGDLRLLALELRNQSEYSVKNMKMVISHPRILVPGRSGNLALEFPSCLHKQLPLKGKDEHIDTWEKPGGLFSFPSDIRVPGGGVFQWPLWLHCAIAGKICVYISIYYEMDNITCDMNYRLLRICHEMEVLPSLDVSISINPCPNKLQEFLVRMEVASKTSTESFWLHQLSSVGSRWKISSLPGHASVCNSQLLLAGQALLCFFKLKDCGHTSSKEGGDLKLGSQEGNETLVDISSSPLADFHYHERLQQGKSIQEDRDTVDFILISQLVEDGANPAIRDQVQLLSHHACHRSITSKNPIWWLMDGPRTIYHDFSVPFCEANFHLTIYNCSEAVVSLKISTFNSTTSALGQAKDSSPRSDSSANQIGWHDVSFDVKLANHDLSASRLENSLTETTTTFVWCASSSTQAELGPLSTVKVPLRICIFSPGIYNLSNYEIQWSLQLTDVGGSIRDVLWKSSGSDKGHPFYLTVLQSSDTNVPHTGLLH